jgi:hypothetical protein
MLSQKQQLFPLNHQNKCQLSPIHSSLPDSEIGKWMIWGSVATISASISMGGNDRRGCTGLAKFGKKDSHATSA